MMYRRLPKRLTLLPIRLSKRRYGRALSLLGHRVSTVNTLPLSLIAQSRLPCTNPFFNLIYLKYRMGGNRLNYIHLGLALLSFHHSAHKPRLLLEFLNILKLHKSTPSQSEFKKTQPNPTPTIHHLLLPPSLHQPTKETRCPSSR